MANARAEHWDNVYRTKQPTEVSWYQADPAVSRELIAATGVTSEAPIIDVGGGASRLVDSLLDDGHTDVTVLDIAEAALEHAKARLGPRATAVTWRVEDVTEFKPGRRYAVWHDRAVFHFLTEPVDRAKYVAALQRALAPDGHVILATFGPSGPERCSGLPIVRYDARSLASELGGGLRLRRTVSETHWTPGGRTQEFVYCWLQAG
jgi:2-polyprenyl-3-methyl-5-hydroxy-6-metoxy-1,4-benzoquinol methylase